MIKKYGIISAALIAFLIITGVVLLMDVFWQSHSQQNLCKNATTEQTTMEYEKKEGKDITEKLTRDVADQVINYGYSEGLAMSNIDVISDEHSILIKVYKKPTNEQTNHTRNKKIDNWSIQIQYDNEYYDRMNEVKNELQSLKNDPAYKIAYYEIEEYPFWENPKIWIVVFELTPENQKLNGTKIQGWEIVQVAKVVRPHSEQ